MRDWTDKYRKWEGTAAELADVAAAIAADIHIADGDTWPNERLVRHYVHVGIIDKAERRGKEAYFGFLQIIQLLATRVLLNDGWPLAKIAEFVRVTDLDSLLGLLPKGAPLTPAQDLVSRFKRSAFSERASSGSLPAPSRKQAPPPVDPMSRSVDLLRQRQEAFPEGTVPEVETWLHVKLTPWCHVYIEREAAHHTPPDLIEHLSRQLAQALIEFIRKGDKK
jgi:hypothetical protein